jgi:hypothetical protein
LALTGKRQEQVDMQNQPWIISIIATFLDSISKTYDNPSKIISFLFPCCIHYNPVEEMIKYSNKNRPLFSDSTSSYASDFLRENLVNPKYLQSKPPALNLTKQTK